MKRLSLFENLLFSAIISIHLYAAFSDAFNLPNFWFSRDDAYYYFKTAQNISLGLGSTFDGINLTNGYHPLWMLVCIPIFYLARFDLILPLRVLLIAIGLLNAVSAVLIYRLISNTLSRAVGILAASFWAFNIYIHEVVYEPGLESPLAAFAVVLFIWKLSQFENEWRTKPITSRQIAALAVISVMVMLSRLDLIFLAFMGGVWIIFRGKPIRFLLPLDAVIIFSAMTASVALRTGLVFYNDNYAASATEAVFLALIIKVTLLYFFGAYQHPGEDSIWTTIRKTAGAMSIGTVLVAGIYIVLLQMGLGRNFPRTAFAIDWGISTILILVLRLAARWFSKDRSQAKISPIAELQSNWKKWLADGAVYYGILGGALGLYMLFNRLLFGTSTPVSGQIKRWWGTMDTIYERPAHTWQAFFGIGYQDAFNTWQPASNLFLWIAKYLKPIYPGSNTLDERYYITMLLFALLALILFAVNKRQTLQKITKMALIPLAAGSGLQILSYTTTAYSGAKEWYWISQMLLVVFIGSLLIDLILQPMQLLPVQAKKITTLTLEITSIAAAVFLAYQFSGYIYRIMAYNTYPADKPYMDVVQFLEENTAPGSVIGMTGGGNVGYFIHDRTIINMDGLINSNDYFQALQNRQAPEYLRSRGLQIIFANVQLLDQPPYYGQFRPYLVNFGVYGGKSLSYLLDAPK
ncbi:MAG: hypothetical protein HY864_13020 [Chloroflexi bacterium]|nr:hypothetical protein [Chloroflexota bacterium]